MQTTTATGTQPLDVNIEGTTETSLELVSSGTDAGARRDTALIILTGVIAVAVLAAVVVLALDGVVDAAAALGVVGGIGTIGGMALGRLTGRP